jgi:hypothetical protein
MNSPIEIGAFPHFHPVVVTFFHGRCTTKIWPLQNKSSMTFFFNSTFSAHSGSVLKTDALIPICNTPNHPWVGTCHSLDALLSSETVFVTFPTFNRPNHATLEHSFMLNYQFVTSPTIYGGPRYTEEHICSLCRMYCNITIILNNLRHIIF